MLLNKFKLISNFLDVYHLKINIVIKILLGILIFLLFDFAIYNAYQPLNNSLSGKWELESNNIRKVIVLPYTEQVPDNTILRFKKTFKKIQADTLVIESIDCAGFEVFINDKLVFKKGDINKAVFNIPWNETYSIYFDPNIIRDDNTLEILVNGFSLSGITSVPYLGLDDKIAPIQSLYNLISYYFFLICMGAILIFGIILLVFGFQNQLIKNIYLNFGISFIFVSIYLFEFVYWGTPSTFLFVILKKITLSSSLIASQFFLMGTEYYCFKKYLLSKYTSSLTVLYLIYIIFIGSPAQLMGSSVNFKDFALLLNLSLVVYFVVKAKKIQLILPIVVLWLTIMKSILTLIMGQSQDYSFIYGIALTLYAFGMILLEDYKNIYHNMIISLNKYTTDALTNTFNRYILSNIVFSSSDIFIVVDIDNFKAINDKYGHVFGDKVLKDFVDISKQNLRDNDLVIRMGGDEFLILLRNCTENAATNIINRIKNKFLKSSDEVVTTFSFGISQFTNNFDDTFKSADESMYDMKNMHKIT